MKNLIVGVVDDIHLTLGRLAAVLRETELGHLPDLFQKNIVSGIIAELLSRGIVDRSNGMYRRNGPHRFPDLLSDEVPGVEIKVALDKNMPKGHLPKAGRYLVCRYAFVDQQPRIFEVRCGEVGVEDFNVSSTPGDSGKTATIKAACLRRLEVIYSGCDVGV